MGQVPAGGEVEAHEGVARLHQGEEDGLVGLGARMGLHIGEAGAEELAGAFDGQALGDVDGLATAVVAAAGITLGVFVGQHAALGFEHGAGDDVLARDEFDAVLLALQFLRDDGGDGRVRGSQAGTEEGIGGSAGGRAVRRAEGGGNRAHHAPGFALPGSSLARRRS